VKLGARRNGVESEHQRRDACEEMRYADGTARLRVATAASGAELVKNLGACLAGDWYVLYVLLVAHTENRPGRYQSPPIQSYDGVTALLDRYRDFLAGDGRHHRWLGSTGGQGMIVYDHHNVLHCYGPLARYRDTLRGFPPGPIILPAPHAHHFHAEFALAERQLLDEWNWTWFPLSPDDDP
jgi:hypothetical protein